MTSQDAIFLAAGVILPIICAFHVFMGRRRVYAAWVRLAVLIICLAALAWAGLDWVLLHSRSFRLTGGDYDRLVGIRGLCGGICIGIVLSISLARPYQTRKREFRSGEAGPNL